MQRAYISKHERIQSFEEFGPSSSLTTIYARVSQQVREVPIGSVRANRQLLRGLDERRVAELSKSIKTNGLLQPILVRPFGSSFEVVFGHHRLEACKRLGWQSIPAIVREMSDDDCFVTKVVENLQRNIEIDPLTEARGYIDLVNHGWTINRIAERIGKSDSYVSDRIGLVRRLDPSIARKVTEGRLKPSHLVLLARLKSRDLQVELSRLVEQRRLSVRKLELLISGGNPMRETVEKNEGRLYIRLPRDMVEHMSIEAGDTVYLHNQSKRRIVIDLVSANGADRKDKRTTEAARSRVIQVCNV